MNYLQKVVALLKSKQMDENIKRETAKYYQSYILRNFFHENGLKLSLKSTIVLPPNALEKPLALEVEHDVEQ
ncbi:MAG: hypothetical protein H7Y41_06700 [Hyphomonadaceae bacterium]|nr:hypothetical protein [Clostridia bacterium]